MTNLRVKLYPIKPSALIGNGGAGTGVGMGGRDKALWNLVYVVAVAHPGHALDGQPLEQLAGDIVISAGLPVLPGRVLLGGDHPSPQGLCHKLASVADPQNGHTPSKNRRVYTRGAVQIDRSWTAGKDNTDGVHGPHLGKRGGPGLDLAVDITLPHTPGNELAILAAKIKNQNGLHRHTPLSP